MYSTIATHCFALIYCKLLGSLRTVAYFIIKMYYFTILYEILLYSATLHFSCTPGYDTLLLLFIIVSKSAYICYYSSTLKCISLCLSMELHCTELYVTRLLQCFPPSPPVFHSADQCTSCTFLYLMYFAVLFCTQLYFMRHFSTVPHLTLLNCILLMIPLYSLYLLMLHSGKRETMKTVNKFCF